MKEYIVTLKAGVNCDDFYDQMVESSKLDHVPERLVQIANERPLSERNTHYYLTDQEAEVLKNDPRVLAVEIPPDQREDIKIGLNAVQNGNFGKTESNSGNFINWGLLRSAFSSNIFSSTNFPSTSSYNFHLDGDGVDVVVHDSGLQVDHPEFNDYNEKTRVQQINWYASSGVPGTQNPNFYRDFYGHGTHVCGIMAGINYGWAKNATIYSLKVSGLEGPGDAGTGIPVIDCFDVVKGWHNNKPTDPITGKKRPTIVNMSWGYSTSYVNLTGGNYRGSNWVGIVPNSSYGMANITGEVSVRIASVDTDLEELIDAGVTVCIAAGNSYFKIDSNGGLDYNNWFGKSGGSQVYYHRGSSPYSEKAIIVGCVDSQIYPIYPFPEKKVNFSNSGPGVDVFSPGTYIMSSASDTNIIGSSNYYFNSSFKQSNISGTSMACPQVAGVCALYAGLNPGVIPSEIKNFIITNSAKDMLYATAYSNDYDVLISLWGGENRYLYFPFASNVSVSFSNLFLTKE